MEDQPRDAGTVEPEAALEAQRPETEPPRDLWRLLKLSWLGGGDAQPAPSGADD